MNGELLRMFLYTWAIPKNVGKVKVLLFERVLMGNIQNRQPGNMSTLYLLKSEW